MFLAYKYERIKSGFLSPFLCSLSIAFRRSKSSGFHQGLALLPGLLIGILALAAACIACESSRAAWSNSSETNKSGCGLFSSKSKRLKLGFKPMVSVGFKSGFKVELR